MTPASHPTVQPTRHGKGTMNPPPPISAAAAIQSTRVALSDAGIDEAPLEVDSSGDSSPTIEEVDNVEDFTKPTDSIPEKKISVSIEHLRKKMEEEK